MKAFMTTLAVALVSSAAFAYDAEKWEGHRILLVRRSAEELFRQRRQPTNFNVNVNN